MTMAVDGGATLAKTPVAKANRQDDEPWAIWAGLMVFLNVLVISGMTFGLAGLVSVMVPAALGMVLVLVRIVTEGM